jgi:EAL domain-containing protein (putative c-di-GMP-specific phosphodiesterase class I)
MISSRRLPREVTEGMSIFEISGPNQNQCGKCGGDVPSIDFDFAFQPIVSVERKIVFAHEALARGPAGEPALSVLDQVTWENRHRFDQECRVRAIERAADLSMSESLSINFIPNAVNNPLACVQRAVRTANDRGFALSRLIFEVTEGERVEDTESLVKIFKEYRKLGIKTAIDDFGAGYAGLNLLARFQPDIVKLDIDLVRDVDTLQVKQIIVQSIVDMCRKLGIAPLAEGVETAGERDFLAGLGIDLMQGFLFARPSFQALALVNLEAWPASVT